MSDDEALETVSTPLDKRGPEKSLPRHRSARARGDAPKGSRLWNHHAVHDAGGVWGGFPQRFLPWALGELEVQHAGRVLHVCSGGIGPQDRAVRVDLRATVRPDVVADGRRLPIQSNAFDAVLIDPPWSLEYAETLYQTDYPRPSHLLSEAARVVRPGRLIGFVHFLVPNPPKGTKFERVIGITQGCGYRIRALTIYRKHEATLFDEHQRT